MHNIVRMCVTNAITHLQQGELDHEVCYLRFFLLRSPVYRAVIGTWQCEGHHANVMPDGALKGTLNRAPRQGWHKMAAVHVP